MKVAYVVGSFPYVSETFIANEIVGVAARGHVVDIFTTCEGEVSSIPPGVHHYGLMRRTHRLFGSHSYAVRLAQLIGLLFAYGWRSPKVVLRALGSFRRKGVATGMWLLYAALTMMRLGARDYDIIHAQFGTYGVIALGLEEIGAMRGAIVTSFRGFDVMKEIQSDVDIYRRLFHKGSLFLPVSATLGRRLLDAGCEPSKMHVHHSGIDCHRVAFAPRTHKKQECTNLITVARLVEKKGTCYALEAVARLITLGRPIHYTIVGDGPLRGSLEDLAKTLDIASQVTFAGWKSHDDAMRLMQSAHVLVAPSITATDGDEEGIPNSVKEAMALGILVVSTTHGGIPELVEDGVSGFLVPERNVEVLAKKLACLIDHPETWAEVSRLARHRIETEFDIEKLNDELIALYQEASAPPRHGRTPDLGRVYTAKGAR